MFESNQSGIETLNEQRFDTYHAGLNRTKVELKLSIGMSCRPPGRWFESNQSGIETNLHFGEMAKGYHV